MQKRGMIYLQTILFVVFLILPKNSISAGAGDYLIMQDINAYKMMGSGGGSKGSGIVTAADHFSIDHTDSSYETIYFNDTTEIGAQVQITQHAGVDSDKWLLHEIEEAYRDGDDSDGRLGLLSGAGVKIRNIGGNKIIYWGLGGGNYTWISGQKVIEIKYTDLQRTKPEPLEVIQAYLQKHPSTIPATMILDKTHDVQWIKDEMDRRLWLCDKWFYQLQLVKVQQGEALQAAVKSMNIFLDYREKYFGVKAADEKNLLAGFMNTSNGTKIKAKLDEYKSWWAANKGNAITLP